MQVRESGGRRISDESGAMVRVMADKCQQSGATWSITPNIDTRTLLGALVNFSYERAYTSIVLLTTRTLRPIRATSMPSERGVDERGSVCAPRWEGALATHTTPHLVKAKGAEGARFQIQHSVRGVKPKEHTDVARPKRVHHSANHTLRPSRTHTCHHHCCTSETWRGCAPHCGNHSGGSVAHSGSRTLAGRCECFDPPKLIHTCPAFFSCASSMDSLRARHTRGESGCLTARRTTLKPHTSTDTRAPHSQLPGTSSLSQSLFLNIHQ
jgi:hypothetical protein